jgi:hypothetical protein
MTRAIKKLNTIFIVLRLNVPDKPIASYRDFNTGSRKVLHAVPILPKVPYKLVENQDFLSKSEFMNRLEKLFGNWLRG